MSLDNKCTGTGCGALMSIKTDLCFRCWKAKRAQYRPTGVPLTADNVADALEATERLGEGATWRLLHWSGVASSWNDKRSFNGWSGASISDVLKNAVRDGTVVTKWRKP